MPTSNQPNSIRVLALIEATSVTGPAKNLFEFCRLAAKREGAGPTLDLSIATFVRCSKRTPPNGSAEQAPNRFVAEARALGIETDVIAEGFRFDTRVLRRLKEIVQRRRPGIVQTHNLKSHFLVWLSRIWREVPWVAFQHGYTTTDFKMRAYNQLDRVSLRAADRVVTVCNPFADALVRTGVARERIRIVHNSTDVDAIPPDASERGSALRASLGIGESEKVILSVGRLSHEKAHVDLLRAAAKIRGDNPSLAFRVVIAGDGPERTRLRSAIESLGLTGIAVLTGHTHDVIPFFAMSDVFALPSHSEGSPNVLLEAMTMRVPVVATAVGGVPEIVTDNETGLLLNPREPARLASRISEVLTEEGLATRLSSAAFVLMSREFSPAARMEALVDVYTDLLSAEEGCGARR